MLRRGRGLGRLPLLLTGTILTLTGLCALAASIGADAQWLAALGQVIARQHAIPVGVPFAVAPTGHWHNVIALAELIFHWLESSMGDRGLIAANLLAVAIALTMLARDAVSEGAEAAGTAAALLIAAVGGFPSLAIARDQLFSLALFPMLMALLRRESRDPSARIWLAPVLLALWSNLHGAAVIGLGVTWLYLLGDRLRRDRVTAVGAAVLSAAAICVTPAGIHTIAYYHGALTNVAAQRGQQEWASFSARAPFDDLLLGAALIFAFAIVRGNTRLRVWELVAAGGLALATLMATRTGVWLLIFLVPPVARSLHPRRTWDHLHLPLALAALAAIGLAIARGPLPYGASRSFIATALRAANGTPIVAEDIIAEQVALAGGRIWVGDPIDAFSKRDQAIYLDWLNGDSAGRQALRPDVKVAIAERGSAAEKLMSRTPGFEVLESDHRAAVYIRRGHSA